MAGRTKEDIRASLLRLLSQKPINKITVRDIVEDCGINRNTFYYHYEDIPSVIEEMITDEAEKIIAGYSHIESLEECLGVSIDFFLDNKKAVMHIHNSSHREMYEHYLWKVCEHVVRVYFDTVLTNEELAPEQKEILINYHKCAGFGLMINWLNGGMKEDIKGDLHKLYTVRHDMNKGKYSDLF